MKVAVVTAATNTIPRFRIDMINEFVHRGCDVLVLGNDRESDWDAYFKEHNVRYRSYRVSRNGINPIDDIGALRELEIIFREEVPDRVFTYQAKPNIYGSIAAHKAGIKAVYVMMGGLGSVFHASGLKSMFVRSVVSRGYRVALKFAAGVFFQNEEDVKTFESLGIIDRNKVHMVRGSGVSLDRFPERPLPPSPSFLFVGRLVRGKGIIDYLEAAKAVKAVHPEVSFRVAGPFDTNPTALHPDELEPYIDEGTIEYLGELLPNEVQSAVEQCSAFVLPSYYGEGTPKSALEAMATGRALIVADAVGCREVVRPGENGFLVQPKNPHEIAAAMERLLFEKGLLERMGAASRRIAERVFDVNKVNAVICKSMGIEPACSADFNKPLD